MISPAHDTAQTDMTQHRLAKAQWLVVILGVVINMLDGFDILSMSFATNGIKQDWLLTEQSLGWLLSAGLMGMAIGSTVNGWLADRYGRRRLILINVLWVGIGMIACALSNTLLALICCRVVTGLGIGGIIANGAVIVSEYAPASWRGTALALYATGYSMGAALGGYIAKGLIPLYGWRSAFCLGAAASGVIWPILWRYLPESIEYLTHLGQDRSQRLTQQTLQRLQLTELPRSLNGAITTNRGNTGLADLRNRQTLQLWAIFFLTMAGFYFLASWIPRLMTMAGLTAAQGLSSGVIQNTGGILGSFVFALLALRTEPRRLLLAALIGSALVVAAVGLYIHTHGNDLSGIWLRALIIGIISNAAMAGLYAVGPFSYQPAVRALGMGTAIGVGRMGAILAPILAGALLDQGMTPPDLLQWSAVVFVLAALLVVGLRAGAHKSAFA